MSSEYNVHTKVHRNNERYNNTTISHRERYRVHIMTNATNLVYKLQIAAIVLMISGSGWNGGNFTPVDAPWWNYFLHFVPTLIMLVLCIAFFQRSGARTRYGWSTIGISILAVISLIGTIVMIILGVVNPDPNSVGVHNFADWVPVVIGNAGVFLWLATFVLAHLSNTQARATSAYQG